MKAVSWNVNGIRACVKKGFMDFFAVVDADIFCIQESKLQEGQIELDMPGYLQYWNYAEKKGYSGTALFTRREPMNVTFGMGIAEHDTEGRLITAEFDDFYFITVYVPNSQDGLRRLEYRQRWEKDFLAYITELDKNKPVIYCGDLNVAHEEIDIKNPATNHFNPGFTDEERACFGAVLDSGFTDTFRHFYPDARDRYSWWSYRAAARERNVGWRIDYFVVSDSFVPRLRGADILDGVTGSDHCPIVLEFD